MRRAAGPYHVAVRRRAWGRGADVAPGALELGARVLARIRDAPFAHEALVERALGLMGGLSEHRAPVALRDAGGAAERHVVGAVAELAEGRVNPNDESPKRY